MKLILHIGQPKTGTTSIQASLRNNKELLLESGILYHAKYYNGHFKYINVLGGQTRSQKNSIRKIKSEINQEIDEIRMLAQKQNIEYILLSAESFFKINLEQKKLLIDLLNLKFDSIFVIAYVRDPAGTYFSRAQQKIKANHSFASPFKFKNNAFTPLKRWATFVGRENIFINPFNKNTLTGNDIVVDFVKLLEKITKKSLSDFTYMKNEQNTSLSAEQMILIQKYRRDFLLEFDNQFHQKSDKLLKFFGEMQEIDSITLTKARLKSNLKSIISSNNKKIIEDIDKYFNTNLLNVFYKDNFDNSPSCAEEKDSYNNIVDIIETYNQKTLDFLSQLIPEYNESIKLSSKGLPSHKALEDPYFLLYYSKYLISIGIIDTSIDLLKRSYLKSKNQKINDLTFYDELINLFRDFAIKIEVNDLKTAQDLMFLAHTMRPNGRHIKSKLDEYSKLILSESEIELKKMIDIGEVVIVPIGFRCWNKTKIYKSLKFSQASLPFDSGFFPPSSVASVIKNPIINLSYSDNNLTHSVCIKYGKQNDPIFGYGIKFQKSTYDEINSIVKRKDVKNINQYLDSTYGYYTLDLKHNFILAHYNWHKFANIKKSKGITNPEANLKNINNLLNKRIQRMFNMCNSAKYIFFIYDEQQGYEYMMIDEQHFDLHDLKDVETAVKDTFTAQSFVTTFTEVNSADKILQMIKFITSKVPISG